MAHFIDMELAGFDPKNSSNMEDEKILNLEVPLGRLKGIKFEMLTRSDIVKIFSFSSEWHTLISDIVH